MELTFHKLSYALASCLAVLATAFVSTMSIMYVNQPEVPEELLKWEG